MEKAYQLSLQLLLDIDKHSKEYTSFEGKNIISEDMLKSLNTIIENGFVLYKYLVEKKLYENDNELTVLIVELEKRITTLEMSEENAKKLTPDSAIIVWDECKLIIACIASHIVDIVNKNKSTTENNGSTN